MKRMNKLFSNIDSLSSRTSLGGKLLRYVIQTALQSHEGGTKKRMSGLLTSEYEGMIGIHETNPNAICHHVLSMYGATSSHTVNSPHQN